MKKIFLLALLPITLFAQKPKLVVGIVVDQMRYEMLNRYKESFGSKGFTRLRLEGFNFQNCNYNYIPTYTGPGHATIFTGVDPKTHGIIANDWYIPSENRMMYCAEDLDVKPVGTTDESSRRSPKNMVSPSIADLIKLENGSKSFGISVKDRGAILPAGKKADGAYWLDGSSYFASSSYYGKKLPQWLIRLNEQELPDVYLNGNWELSKEPSFYGVSDVDDRACEITPMKRKPVFPYNLQEAKESEGRSIIKYTPWGNSLIADAALELIKNEQLGKDDKTDFLSISFSSTDYAGHAFGPRSWEVQDMYIKLDQEIERIIDYLNTNVGEGQYLLFLTSDHGVVDCPGTKTNPAEYVSREAIMDRLDSICMAEYGGKLISNMTNHQIWFDHELIKEMHLTIDDVAFVVLEKMREYKGGTVFDGIWTKEDLLDCSEMTCEQFKKAFQEDLAGDGFFSLKSGYLLSNSMSGTSHGSGYSYDTHVPLIFYGWNVKPGYSDDAVNIQDIAPTVYELLGLTTKSSFDGTSQVSKMN